MDDRDRLASIVRYSPDRLPGRLARRRLVH
jgi:hypothetical protein